MTPEERAAREKEAIDAYVERVVAEAPPVTDEQRAALINLLSYDYGRDDLE